MSCTTKNFAETCSVFNTIDGLEILIANFLLVENSVLSMKAPSCGERQHVPASMQVLALFSSGWWFQTFGLFSIILYGMSSFPLTNSIIFQDGEIAPPTSYIYIGIYVTYPG